MAERTADVQAHWTRPGVLARLDAALTELGHDPQKLTPEILAAVKHLHSGAWPPVVPENLIRADSRDEGESGHHPVQCLRSSSCSGRLSPTCSSRGAGLQSRTSFSGISSISP